MDFKSAYRVTKLLDGEPQSYEAFVALGVVQLETSKLGLDWFRFCRNNAVRFDADIFGRVVEDTGDRVVVSDARENLEIAQDVQWVFEFLTVDRWQEMIANEAVSGARGDEFATDDDLQNYYLLDYLPDYWTERKESGQFAVELKALVDGGEVP